MRSSVCIHPHSPESGDDRHMTTGAIPSKKHRSRAETLVWTPRDSLATPNAEHHHGRALEIMLSSDLPPPPPVMS
eukprot:4346542-Pleurochrysis_carterae.AAC.1